MINRFIYRVTFCLVLLMSNASLRAQRIIESVNIGWTFTKDGGESELVTIPHTWNAVDSNDEIPGYFRGDGWYRKTVKIDPAMKGKCVELFFEGANQVVELWVNGHHAGRHTGGYTFFNFDITPYVVMGENKLEVKVSNTHQADVPPLSADFTFFGGIYRDVYLRFTNPIHISTSDCGSDGVYVTTPQVNEQWAEVQIKTLLDNATNKPAKLILLHQLFDEAGQLVAHKKQIVKLPKQSRLQTFNETARVQTPYLWSPDTPHLYRLVTTISDEGKNVVDRIDSHIGFRWFSFDAEKGFSLNGKPLKLIGTNRHQDFLGLGNALSDELHIRDLRLIKDMGANFLRISHYPQDPVVLQMCDKLGIITSLEIPIVNTITESDAFTHNSLNMMEEMVKQNYNHPSVLIWAYMNEVMLRPPYSGDERMATYNKAVGTLASQIENLTRKLDPMRYTMIPFHGNLKAYEDAGLVEIPRIIGWNLYQGWYSGTFDGFGKFLDNVHDKYPTVPLIVTEYGADVDPRLHSFIPERFDFTAEYGIDYHYHYLKDILARNYLSGATIWNFNDFFSEARADAVPHVNNKGITGVDRELKDTYLYYKAHFNREPMVTWGNRSWTYRGGSALPDGDWCTQTVTLYSNLDTVEVFHNGASMGQFSVRDNRVELAVDFVNGKNTLMAIGAYAGRKVCDNIDIHFCLIPYSFKSCNRPFEEINVLLGSKRYFEDRLQGQVWIPEQPYREGSWGYIGGNPYKVTTKYGKQPSSEMDILGTSNDPIFQTQRQGIEQFKLDVAPGDYAVSLYWAELEVGKKDNILAYNLGNDVVLSDVKEREFGYSINGAVVESDLNLTKEYGVGRAVVRKHLVTVIDNRGLVIDFIPMKGEPVLNAIRIERIY